MCVKQIAPSWRNPQPSAFQGTCVPSPQSTSVSDGPQRIKAQESQRPGIGIMPHVPNIQISIKTIYPFSTKSFMEFTLSATNVLRMTVSAALSLFTIRNPFWVLSRLEAEGGKKGARSRFPILEAPAAPE